MFTKAKDFEERAMESKREVIKTIENLLTQIGRKHELRTWTYIHYVEGEVATAEECLSVSLDEDNRLEIEFKNGFGEIEHIGGGSITGYDIFSFVDILAAMEEDLREECHEMITDIMVKDEEYPVDIPVVTNSNIVIAETGKAIPKSSVLNLTKVKMDSNGFLTYFVSKDGESFEITGSEIEITSLLNAAQTFVATTIPVFNVKVVAMYSREIQIKATSEEDAEKKAKEFIKANPLNEDDLDYIQCQM